LKCIYNLKETKNVPDEGKSRKKTLLTLEIKGKKCYPE
jgi:hypothetical protein